ncbi:hypothetical protein EDD29_4630 [Actinocorallia herbida]|uniref:Uncharacterized protein n=1 Tax=Actinocorallia herbida TaxID=58109 RepID=A0A3N1D0J1_9ACTN|nr:hypothetical protein [Actinocorallia herbida]ROO87041.1 hypothetical protein EDD29_4630 [Actinocorallia herbida]
MSSFLRVLGRVVFDVLLHCRYCALVAVNVPFVSPDAEAGNPPASHPDVQAAAALTDRELRAWREIVEAGFGRAGLPGGAE